MSADTVVGWPLRCAGCGRLLTRITPQMRPAMPEALSWRLFGNLGWRFVVCPPDPDGQQPCLRQAILQGAVLIAQDLAPGGGFEHPVVIACLPAEFADWWTSAGGTTYRPRPATRLIRCDNPRCGAAMWLEARAQLVAAAHRGHCVRLCLPCAIVEHLTRAGGDLTSGVVVPLW